MVFEVCGYPGRILHVVYVCVPILLTCTHNILLIVLGMVIMLSMWQPLALLLTILLVGINRHQPFSQLSEANSVTKLGNLWILLAELLSDRQFLFVLVCAEPAVSADLVRMCWPHIDAEYVVPSMFSTGKSRAPPPGISEAAFGERIHIQWHSGKEIVEIHSEKTERYHDIKNNTFQLKFSSKRKYYVSQA